MNENGMEDTESWSMYGAMNGQWTRTVWTTSVHTLHKRREKRRRDGGGRKEEGKYGVGSE